MPVVLKAQNRSARRACAHGNADACEMAAATHSLKGLPERVSKKKPKRKKASSKTRELASMLVILHVAGAALVAQFIPQVGDIEAIRMAATGPIQATETNPWAPGYSDRLGNGCWVWYGESRKAGDWWTYTGPAVVFSGELKTVECQRDKSNHLPCTVEVVKGSPAEITSSPWSTIKQLYR